MVMALAYHDDPERHQDFGKAVEGAVVSEFVKSGVAKPAGDGKLYTELVQAAVAVPLRMDAKLAQIGHGRQMAADLMLTTLTLHRHVPEIASLEKAIDLIQQRNVGTKRATSRASLLAAWSQYKSVAHILAAYELRRKEMDEVDALWGEDTALTLEEEFSLSSQDDGLPEELDLMSFLVEKAEAVAKTTEVLSEFVALTQQIGLDAARTFSHGQMKVNRPLVRLDELWLLPDDIDLPAVTVDYPPLSADDRRRLGL